jgi:uncharacterized protein (DUF2141 family)
MNLNLAHYALQAFSKVAGGLAFSSDKPLPSALIFHRFTYLAILALTISLSHPLHAADIKLSVENITEPSGTLLWSVFDSEEAYDAESAPLFAGRSRVVSQTLDVTFHHMPPGNYAVRLFHDANDNGEMDKNIVGFPQEGYGFSNNGGSFGPASFADAKVEVKEDTQITIRLR